MTRALVFLSLFLATAANADDVWVIDGIDLKPAGVFCRSQTLGAATTLHNPTDGPLDVTLLDTTDSRPRSGSTLRVPPHRTANLWFPSAIPPGAARDSLTVWHLDVPASCSSTRSWRSATSSAAPARRRRAWAVRTAA